MKKSFLYTAGLILVVGMLSCNKNWLNPAPENPRPAMLTSATSLASATRWPVRKSLHRV